MIDTYIFVIAGFVAFAVLVSAGYYFARYFFRGDTPWPTAQHLPSQQLRKKTKPQNLFTALHKTRGHWASVQDVEQLEAALYGSDMGPHLIDHLMQHIQHKTKPPYTFEKLRPLLKSELLDVFQHHPSVDLKSYLLELEPSQAPTYQKPSGESEHHSTNHESTGQPKVYMIVGVNGSGKTTSIGRLAHIVKHKKTMVVAGDTFRAAADLQLQTWAARAGAEFFALAKQDGKTLDPSAVVFEALQRAKSEGFERVWVDTAGRLHTQKNLMRELQKVKRTMAKLVPDAPHEVWLVADASQGQNVIQQGREFHENLNLTGVVLTKLDGSSRGGCAIALWRELGVPLRAVGVGEGLDDMQSFKPQNFVEALLLL